MARLWTTFWFLGSAASLADSFTLGFDDRGGGGLHTTHTPHEDYMHSPDISGCTSEDTDARHSAFQLHRPATHVTRCAHYAPGLPSLCTHHVHGMHFLPSPPPPTQLT